MDSGLLFHFPITIAEWGISGDLLAFLTQSPADFNEPQRTDDASRQQSHEFTTFG